MNEQQARQALIALWLKKADDALASDGLRQPWTQESARSW